MKKAEKELILARLEVLSPELHFSDGENKYDLSRDEMIDEIKGNSKIGKEFVATELKFLRAIKEGTINKLLVSE